jgi:hypothetical protein
MSQSRGKRTGLGGDGGADATGGVIGAGEAAEAVPMDDVAVAGVFGGNGRVTVGLSELAVDPGNTARRRAGTPRRKAGKHSRFARAR